MTFQIILRGTSVKVDVTSSAIAFTVIDGESVRLAVRGQYFTVSAGNPVRVPLTHQGPRVNGPVPSKTVDRRPDGTLITASVPQAVVVGR